MSTVVDTRTILMSLRTPHCCRRKSEAERILYQIMEGDSDLELSDEEKDKNENRPVIGEDGDE